MNQPLTIGAITAAFMFTLVPVAAAPLGVPTVDHAATSRSIVIEASTYRRCWWQDGRRQCRMVERRPRGDARDGYGITFGQPRPEDLPTGSPAWWRRMDEEGRGGHGDTP
jgi:hypothetical protein